MKPLELYIHIPFCISKCKYCDFLSAPSSEEERTDYVKSLCEEIRSYENLARAYCVVSIFVGGGTPSILKASQMESIFNAIKETFLLISNAEITLEINPGTVDSDKLKCYKNIGINRLSIGLQSADNDELKSLGRIHTYEDFLCTYKMAREEGFSNINVDLMSAVPGQTVETWEKTLHVVSVLKPEHISAYSLIIEEGTPFYELYAEQADRNKKAEIERKKLHEKEEKLPLPDEETERQMYWRTKEILEKYGYHHYEISNYAKEGFACRHNLGYWERMEYLGIGAGASSLLNNRRWMQSENVRTFAEESKERMEEAELLTETEQMEEFMFLGLRKMEGVSKTEFQRQFQVLIDEIYGKVTAELCQEGLLEEEGDFVRLTERGIDISNYVMSEFLM